MEGYAGVQGFDIVKKGSDFGPSTVSPDEDARDDWLSSRVDEM